MISRIFINFPARIQTSISIIFSLIFRFCALCVISGMGGWQWVRLWGDKRERNVHKTHKHQWCRVTSCRLSHCCCNKNQWGLSLSPSSAAVPFAVWCWLFAVWHVRNLVKRKKFNFQLFLSQQWTNAELPASRELTDNQKATISIVESAPWEMNWGTLDEETTNQNLFFRAVGFEYSNFSLCNILLTFFLLYTSALTVAALFLLSDFFVFLFICFAFDFFKPWINWRLRKETWKIIEMLSDRTYRNSCLQQKREPSDESL